MQDAREWIEYEMTPPDVAGFAKFIFRRQQRQMRERKLARFAMRGLLVLLGIAVALMGFIAVMTGSLEFLAALVEDPLVRGLVGAILGVALLYAGLLFAMPALAVAAAKRSRHVLGSHRVRLGEDGVHVVSKHKTAVVAYSGIEEVAEDRGAVILLLSATQGLIIPASAFPGPEARTAFIERCREGRAAGDGPSVDEAQPGGSYRA